MRGHKLFFFIIQMGGGFEKNYSLLQAASTAGKSGLETKILESKSQLTCCRDHVVSEWHGLSSFFLRLTS